MGVLLWVCVVELWVFSRLLGVYLFVLPPYKCALETIQASILFFEVHHCCMAMKFAIYKCFSYVYLVSLLFMLDMQIGGHNFMIWEVLFVHVLCCLTVAHLHLIHIFDEFLTFCKWGDLICFSWCRYIVLFSTFMFLCWQLAGCLAVWKFSPHL